MDLLLPLTFYGILFAIKSNTKTLYLFNYRKSIIINNYCVRYKVYNFQEHIMLIISVPPALLNKTDDI